MSQTARAVGRALARLSSGRRINEARDDAAGLAVSTRMESQVRGLAQSARNINQVFGYLNTADGTMEVQLDIVQRMRELSMQAASGTIGATDRAALNEEFQTLLEEFRRLSESAQFNGVNLLDGTNENIRIQGGTSKEDFLNISLSSTYPLDDIFYSDFAQGTGTLNQATTSSISSKTNNGVILQDLNGDGFADLVTGNGDLRVYFGDGEGGFDQNQSFTTAEADYLTAADMNGDGFTDILAVTQAATSTLSVLLNDGEGNFSLSSSYALGASSTEAVVGDINGDGNQDVLVGGTDLSILNGDGVGGFGTRQTVAGILASYVQTMDDLDGDGTDEFAFRAGTATIRFYLGVTSGAYVQAQSIVASPNNSFTIDDGKMVISRTTGATLGYNWSAGSNWTAGVIAGMPTGHLTTHISSNRWLMQNSTTNVLTSFRFSESTQTTLQTITLPVSGTRINVSKSDLNNDGENDLVVAQTGGAIAGTFISTYLGSANGTFTLNSTQLVSTSALGRASIGDIDGDDVSDIVVTDQTSGSTGGLVFATQETEDIRYNPEVTISTQANAQEMLKVMELALNEITSRRAALGAISNRLEFAVNNALIMHDNLAAAKSQLMDVDIASEVSELTRAQILQQGQAASLTQANLSMNLVLNLLRP